MDGVNRKYDDHVDNQKMELRNTDTGQLKNVALTFREYDHLRKLGVVKN